MNTVSPFFQIIKPGIPKRYLLLVAACFWTFAGGMLLFRGFSVLKFNSSIIEIEESGSILAGLLFYKFMFSAISLKHIHRILNLKEEKPCFFSFFNGRSYLLMTVMMASGITLRVTGLVPLSYLSPFYIAMGTPLLLSAFRFYYYACKTICRNNKGVSVT
jgi:hypothetical protein